MRASGILLHITSLPTSFEVGDLGPEAFRFVKSLHDAKQRYWSILPLSPTRLEDGNSPYQTSSAFAGNPLLISPEKLLENGLLSKYMLHRTKPSNKVKFNTLYTTKKNLLKRAYNCFNQTNGCISDASTNLVEFCCVNKSWLDDYALYTALREASGLPWHKWPPMLRKREPQVIERKSFALREEIDRQKFIQYIFFNQFSQLKKYCQTMDIQIIGDMPFYVSYDSVDIWSHPELFSLNSNGSPKFIGGVPPDYFSDEGQLWGNPTYNWRKMEETGFQWWMERIRHNLGLYDKLRLDHFRGFVAYWRVPARAKTAKKGKWVKAPSENLLKTLKKNFPSLPFIAEDLGYIDEPVKTAISKSGMPGMRVLLFSFDGDPSNPHLPINHTTNSVVYTGTHDTNTVRGWFTQEASHKEKRNLFKIVGKKVDARQVSLELVKVAMASISKLSIVPLQDLLGLSSKARMNNPGSTMDNWEWRALPEEIAGKKFEELEAITALYCR